MENDKNFSLENFILFSKQSMKLLIRNSFFVLIICFIGGLIGYFFAKIQRPFYIAKYSFILNENEGGATLNLASLAGIAGISGLGGANNSINEDKLLYIANSRLLIGKSLLKEFCINEKKMSLVNHFIDIYELHDVFKSDTALTNFTYFSNKGIDKLNYAENKVLDIIIKKINDSKLLTIDSKKKTGIVIQSAGIISMDFKSIDEKFSKYFLESLYENLSEYYTSKTIHRQYKNYLLIQNRADSIRDLIYLKEDYGAQVSDKNLKVVKMIGKLDLERNRRDIQILNLMYAEVLKNLEVAKFNLDNQTPFFQPIDQPTFPLEVKKKSKVLFALIGFLLSFSTLSVYLIGKNFKKIKSLSFNQ